MNTILKFVSSSFFLLLFYSTANTQSFINSVSLNGANLTPVQFQRYVNLGQDVFTKNLNLISLGDPRSFVNGQGTLEFEYPGIQGIIRAQAIDIAQTDSSYSWTGRLLNYNGYFGYYDILGHRAAFLQIGTRFFEIMPISPGVNTSREIEGNVTDSGSCFQGTEGQTNSEVNLCSNDYNTCTANIDILVLLPPDATNWLQTKFGNDWFSKALYIGIGTQALNAAFINSDIPNKKANIILENFNMQYPSGTNCLNLLNALQSQATARRNAVGADLVVLITANADYNCGSGAACAEISENPPYACDPGFAFSEIWWLFHPRWSMLHEVGHLMGGGHDRPNDNDNDCAHGWTVGGNRFQRTLMALWFGTQTPTDTRILHYSNPDVVFNGDPTGTINDNNAKVIRNGACIVANYRQRLTFDAGIDADPWVCRSSGDDIYLNANIQIPSVGNPGAPPYSFEWRWNFSGNFSGGNSTLIGTTQFASFPIPPTGNHVWVQLKVTSSDGIVLTKLKQIEILDDTDPKCKWKKEETHEKQKPNFDSPGVVLVPNPAQSSVELKWRADAAADVVIQLTDGLGRKPASFSTTQTKGENSFYIDLGTLPAGVYYVSHVSDHWRYTQKLIVNH